MSPFFSALVLAAAFVTGPATAAPPVERLRLPPGFKVEVYADKEKYSRWRGILLSGERQR